MITKMIEVDPLAADILLRAAERARSNGLTLGSYLSQELPAEQNGGHSHFSQREAWEAFVAGMSDWSKSNLPPGAFIDDSRESMYDDRC